MMKTGNGFLDNEWFSGAQINLAENILKIRDGRLALICEGGTLERLGDSKI